MTVKRRTENSSSISSIMNRDDGLLFTTVRGNTDHVTLSRVCEQTEAEESDLVVFILGQLKDNALDSTVSYASATSVPSSYGVTTITNNNRITNLLALKKGHNLDRRR